MVEVGIKLDQTKEFFAEYFGIELSDEEARDTAERISELYLLLDKWDKERKLPPCALFWITDREDELRCG